MLITILILLVVQVLLSMSIAGGIALLRQELAKMRHPAGNAEMPTWTYDGRKN